MSTIAQEFIQKGLEQDLERGMERGRLQEKRNIARQLLALHDVVTVSELTGLSVDEVTTLQEAMRRREEDGGGNRADESE